GQIVRTVQPREPRRYLAAPDALPAQHLIASRELPFEFMLNALRLPAGFTYEGFTARTGLSADTISPQITSLKARRLIELTALGCRPSPLGLRFLNDVLLEFMPENSQMTGSSTLSMTSHEPGRAATAPLYTGSQAPAR